MTINWIGLLVLIHVVGPENIREFLGTALQGLREAMDHSEECEGRKGCLYL